MRAFKMMVLASTLAATAALAAEPKLTETTCAQLVEKYQATDEAKARFAQLQGSCQGVYDVNGAQYVLVKAVYRGRKDGQTVLYLPATDRTVQFTPRPEARVVVDGRKVKPSSLSRGDEVEIYLSVDKFATERVVEEITLATEEASEPIVSEAVSEAAAEPTQVAAVLPTTGSPLPLVAAVSLTLLAMGGLLRRPTPRA